MFCSFHVSVSPHHFKSLPIIASSCKCCEAQEGRQMLLWEGKTKQDRRDGTIVLGKAMRMCGIVDCFTGKTTCHVLHMVKLDCGSSLSSNQGVGPLLTHCSLSPEVSLKVVHPLFLKPCNFVFCFYCAIFTPI